MFDRLGGPSDVHIYVHGAISAQFDLAYARHLCLIDQGGSSAVHIYVHCAISARFGVVVCNASMLN